MVVERVRRDGTVIKVADEGLIQVVREDFVGHEEVVPCRDGGWAEGTFEPGESAELALKSQVFVGTRVYLELVVAELVVDD